MGASEEPAGLVRVAAFDFDGTLSKRDTLIPFLVRLDGPAGFARVSTRLGLAGAKGQIDRTDRDAMKAAVLRELVAGRDEADLARRGRIYARDLMANQLRTDVLDRLDQHRDRGDIVVFVSASLRVYLDPLAQRLGIDDVIAVELASDDGILTGELARPNVRAEQKALRLTEWLHHRGLGATQVEMWAYGNSSGDHALLEMADHPIWLGPARKTPPGVALFDGLRLG